MMSAAKCESCCHASRIINKIPIKNLELVKSVDVEPAIRGNLVDLDDRTQFAAQLDEIESRVDLENYRGKIKIFYCFCIN